MNKTNLRKLLQKPSHSLSLIVLLFSFIVFSIRRAVKVRLNGKGVSI
jgi:hypothetical protein